MKKSTFLIILIVFVLSVVVVGLFGMRVTSYDTKVYVNEILPTQIVLNDANYTIYTYYRDGNSSDKNQIRKLEGEQNTYYVFVPYFEGLTIIADYEVVPNDASNRNLKITITSDSKGGVQGEGGAESNSVTLNNNIVTFKQRGNVCITFRSTDGSNKIMNLRIYMD